MPVLHEVAGPNIHGAVTPPRNVDHETANRAEPRGSDLCVAAEIEGLDFTLAVQPRVDGDVIAVAGEIDLATAPRLHTALDQLLARGRTRVTVDLTAVTFLDCSALTFLLTAQQATAMTGGSLRVTGRSYHLSRMITALGMTDAFTLD